MNNFSFKTIAIKPRLVSLTLCAILITSGLCLAATYTVDDDGPANFTKIQDAINAAANDDIVLVSQGHYYENIDFHGKAITITSTNPYNTNVVADTIIDANDDGIVVSFHTEEGPDSTITGFTITAGHAKYGAGICCWNNCSPTISYCVITQNNSQDISESRGAGISCQSNSNPLISDCTFSNNSANACGGGMFNSSSSSTVTNCIFSGNLANHSGGGMYNYSGSPTVTNCTFSNNSANYYGGGMSMSNSSNGPTVTDCTFSGNSAIYGYGGGMYNYFSSPTVTDCTFSGNSANYYGGGMYSDWHSNPTVTDCAFSGNSANTYGGGICCEYQSSPTIRNCTITGNRAATGAGGIDLGENCDAVITNNIICNSPSGSGIYALYCDPVISYNNVYGNADGDYDGWAWPGEGDISVDPLFIDPGYWDDNGTPGDTADDFWVDGDYHLHYDSLCINAGDPTFIPEPGEVDMDNEDRVRLGRVDMGADEAGSNPADFDESGSVNLPDFSILAAAWLSNSADPQFNDSCDISTPADESIDILDLAAYSNQWLWQANWN